MFASVLELVYVAVLVAMPAWWWLGLTAALGGALLAVFVYALFLIWKTHRIERWLAQADLNSPLPWNGVWSEIAHRVQRLLRHRDKLTLAADQRLQFFLQAIQASPNGVTLLDAQGRIEWCNLTASRHLGVDSSRDVKQHILHLVRDPIFAKYFALETHEEEAVIEGRSSTLSKSPKLSVQLHAYGDGMKLLLTRDVTSVALADAMRRDFVANVSHEIRTPLTVLMGFVETLQSIPLTDDERQHYLDLMSVQADRMQILVADLLTLSQLEGSLPSVSHETVSLPELMNRVALDAQALSAMFSTQEGDDRGPAHELIFETTPAWALSGVRSELLSATSNLVNNAIRYTPPGGRIRVAWLRTPEGVIFSVKDTGPGIASEHLPRLSERFYRVDRSRSRETGGTGLGLAIAKHVAQRHGGELRIESQVGVGSDFMLFFPLSRISTLSEE